MSDRIDWETMMRLGLGVLRQPPDVFWSMTPVELRRALEGAGVVGGSSSAMSRNEFSALMAQFPDGRSE